MLQGLKGLFQQIRNPDLKKLSMTSQLKSTIKIPNVLFLSTFYGLITQNITKPVL